MDIYFDDTAEKQKKQNKRLKSVKDRLSHDNTVSLKNEDNKLYYEKFCVICLAEFTAQRSDALTCSEVCKRKLRYDLKNNKQLPHDIKKHKQKIEKKRE